MTVTEFVDQRLESFRDRPEMWGCDEAVEMQALLLVEMERVVLGKDPTLLLMQYHNELHLNFPKHGAVPLCEIIQEMGQHELFGKWLYTLIANVRQFG